MSEFQKLVNRLTNWQRHQWAKAGYSGAARSPKHRLGQAPENIDKLKPFLELHRPNRSV